MLAAGTRDDLAYCGRGSSGIDTWIPSRL